MDPSWGPIAALSAAGVLALALLDRLTKAARDKEREANAFRDIEQLKKDMARMLPREEFRRWVHDIRPAYTVLRTGRPDKEGRTAIEIFDQTAKEHDLE